MANLEDRLVQRIATALRAEPSSRSLRLAIGDDAAIFQPKSGYETLLTCDWFLEGIHFLRQAHPPDSVGWKCLARAVSDIAAIGGQPQYFLLSLALPASRTGRWLGHFLRGLRRAARRFHCVLAGGDTTRRTEILINITVIGRVPTGQAVQRAGAKPGDLIFVTGRLGEAELGLTALRGPRATGAQTRHCLQKHLYPEPRIALGQWLAKNRIASSMMDLSDGLSTDLSRLCARSHVGALIDVAKLPALKSPGGKRAFDPAQLALNGGDDYELLFTSHSSKARHLPRSFAGTPITCIGKITRKLEVLVRETDGRKKKLLPGGWDPFRK